MGHLHHNYVYWRLHYISLVFCDDRHPFLRNTTLPTGMVISSHLTVGISSWKIYVGSQLYIDIIATNHSQLIMIGTIIYSIYG